MNVKSILLALLAVAALASPASAQTWPDRSIKLVVAFPAGGPADLFARSIAHVMSSQLGQQVVVETRTGAGGMTGIDSVAKSPPDGYTIALSSSSALTIFQFLYAKMPYDWQKDLVPITLVVRVPEVLVVHPSLGVSTLQQFVDKARKEPGKINFASTGTGSITHLAVELLKGETKIDLVHVPYKGAAPAVNDLLGGHVSVLVADVPVLLPHIRSGKIKPLAVTSMKRSDVIPDVPSTAELGYPKVNSDNWYGLVAPAGTPKDVLKKLHDAAVKALGTAELKAQYAKLSAVPSPTSPEEFQAYINSEAAKWGSVVKSAGLKLN
ncbi:MAG: Bug family tripartite tricarboxylate transporter substrate binding protein [Xanthobacteraceae bacterium]